MGWDVLGRLAALRRRIWEDRGGNEAATSATASAPWLKRGQMERGEVRSLLEDPEALVPYFQPIAALRFASVAGYEALSRFPTLPNRSPASVFAQAHHVALGSFLEAKAIAAALGVPDRPPGTFLSLNVSPSALVSRAVEAVLPRSLDGFVIEITEQEIAAGTPALGEALALVRERGAHVAVDDVGSGYAGLKHLIDLSPEIIKIDRVLIDGVHRDFAKAALVESIASYAERIGADVCAEGVEDPRDLEFIGELGLTYAQGFAFARPSTSWVGRASSAWPTPGNGEIDPDREQPTERVRARLSQLLETAQGWEEIDECLGLLTLALAVDEAHLSRVHGKRGFVVTVAGHGETPSYDVPYPLAEYPATAEVLDRKKPLEILANDERADPSEVELLLAQGMKAALLFPIVKGGRSLGLLEIYSHRARHWGSEDTEYLASVSRQSGDVLERLKRPRPPTATPTAQERSAALVRARMGLGETLA